MRKKLSILLILVMMITMVGKPYQVKAYDEQIIYSYMEVDGQKAWYKNYDEKIDVMPEQLEEGSQVVIETTPDEECAAYLASFYEPNLRVTVLPGVTVTFGSPETKTSIQGLTCHDANVTVYAEGGEFNEETGLPGSVYGVTCFNSTIKFYGNIQYLCLGDEFTYEESKINAGNVDVEGSVYTVEWYKTAKYTDDVYYRGFTGNASVSGKVECIYVREIKHSNILNADIKATVAEGYRLPSFTMTNGVIDESLSEYIYTYNPNMEKFYFEYSPAGDGNWYATARYPSGEETQYSKMISAEEMLEVLESGEGRLGLWNGNDLELDLGDYDISELKVSGGNIIVNNITTEEGNGLLQIDSYGRDIIDIKVKGDVDNCRISFTRFNENMNIDVDGTIKKGEVYKSSLQTDFSLYLGTFTSTDMPLFVDGVWNPDLFLSLGTAEYHPVDDAVLEDALGLEDKTSDNGEEISEMADMLIWEMEEEALGELDNNDEFESCVDEYGSAKALTGLDIQLEKFDYNENTGEVSNQEVVTELGEGKDISITVKVPADDYSEDKEYIIVREHDNNGTTEMDVLVPTQDGDKLTFKTNKFSSFIIVEVTEKQATDDKIDLEDKDDKNDKDDTKEETKKEETKTEDSKLPVTGDNNNDVIWVMMWFVALVGLVLYKKTVMDKQ